jgi:hypothetical protein
MEKEGCDYRASSMKLAVLTSMDSIPGQIICKRGSVCLFGLGYPDQETGRYDEFLFGTIIQESGKLDLPDSILIQRVLEEREKEIFRKLAEGFINDDIGKNMDELQDSFLSMQKLERDMFEDYM